MQNKETLSRLIVENKFYDLTWEILLEDSSSFSNDISLVKILVKIIYINIPNLDKKELNLIFDEKNFEVLNTNKRIINLNRNFTKKLIKFTKIFNTQS
jgi:hypothetical protein